MKKGKKNKVITILVIAIVFAICTDALIVIHFKNDLDKKQLPIMNENETLELDKKVECHKQDEIINQKNGIQYQVIEDYNFYVAKNKKIISDGDLIVLTFDTLSDLRTYYDYLLNDIKVVVTENVVFEKNENDLTITHKHYALWGGNDYFEESLLETYIKDGYICKVSDINNLKEN